MRHLGCWLLAFSLISPGSAWAVDPPAESNPEREFIMSCTYGVLAGSLVGAASLAFTDKPGDNLKKVARGASLGLYTGILLGLYVVYVVPNMGDDEDYDPQVGNFNIFPMISDQGVEGAAFDLTLARW